MLKVMGDSLTFKRSPIVPIRTFFGIEIMALAVFLVATNFDHLKYQAYTSLPISSLFSYDTTKFLFLSAMQFVITIYAFLYWYHESFSIQRGSLIYRKGILFKKETTFPLERSMVVTLSSGPFGKHFHYGSIRVENHSTHSSIVLKDISHPAECAKIMREYIDPHAHLFDRVVDVAKLCAEEEHERLEFKSSLRFDHKLGQPNRELEKSAMKTIAAFLNSKGGYLVLGIGDTRAPVGLENDYKTLPRGDRDAFQNHFTQVYNTMIGPEFRHLVNLSFHTHEGHEVCVVHTAPSPRPVYLKSENNEHFYVRTGNVTTPLKLSEVELYTRSRWPAQTESV